MAKFKDVTKEWDGKPVDAIVCIPVSRESVPAKDSTVEQCYNCEQEIWLAPSSLIVIDTYPDTRLECLDCLLLKVKEVDAGGDKKVP